MKNSNKWLLAAALLLLTSLTAYNMALRTAYHTGDFKNPLRDYTTLRLSNFSEVAVPAASAMSVKIVAGPFGVRVSPRAGKFVKITQQGQQLVLTPAFADEFEYLAGDAVVISCPRLAALRTDASYQLAGQPHVDKQSANGHVVRVQGFTQDSLTLRQDRGSSVELAGNRLGYLDATAGASVGSHATLQLATDNRIAAARLRIDHQSELRSEIAIPGLRCQFADSARATLTGAALGSLVK